MTIPIPLEILPSDPIPSSATPSPIRSHILSQTGSFHVSKLSDLAITTNKNQFWTIWAVHDTLHLGIVANETDTRRDFFVQEMEWNVGERIESFSCSPCGRYVGLLVESKGIVLFQQHSINGLQEISLLNEEKEESHIHSFRKGSIVWSSQNLAIVYDRNKVFLLQDIDSKRGFQLTEMDIDEMNMGLEKCIWSSYTERWIVFTKSTIAEYTILLSPNNPTPIINKTRSSKIDAILSGPVRAIATLGEDSYVATVDIPEKASTFLEPANIDENKQVFGTRGKQDNDEDTCLVIESKTKLPSLFNISAPPSFAPLLLDKPANSPSTKSNSSSSQLVIFQWLETSSSPTLLNTETLPFIMPDLLTILHTSASNSFITIGSNTLNTLTTYEFNKREHALTKSATLSPQFPSYHESSTDQKMYTLGLATYGQNVSKLVVLYGVEEQVKEGAKEKSLLFGFKSANKKDLRLVLEEWVINVEEEVEEEEEVKQECVRKATESSSISLQDIAAMLSNMTSMLKEVKERQIVMDNRLDKLESLFQTRI